MAPSVQGHLLSTFLFLLLVFFESLSFLSVRSMEKTVNNLLIKKGFCSRVKFDDTTFPGVITRIVPSLGELQGPF